MFNLSRTLTDSFRPLVAESSELVKGHREALLADFEIKTKLLMDAALKRLLKIMLIASALVASGLFAVAGALFFRK